MTLGTAKQTLWLRLRRRAVFLIVGVVVCGLLGVLALGLARGHSEEAGAATGPATPFSLATFQGDTFDLAGHARGPVFVYFWASWCTPCVQEAPLIEQL